MTFKSLTLTAVALAAISMSLPAFAEDTPQPPPAGEEGGPPPEHGDGGPRGGGEGHGKEMFDKTDTNHDGFLSKDEMEASQKARLDEMFTLTDTNKDGKLSPEELKKGRELMREKFKEKMKDRPQPQDKKAAE
jgi:hypothetical protein